MRLAIREARKGWPAPNPHVGCVLVRDDQVVALGHHAYAGGPHAEAVALALAGDSARGCTAYVTLEPCAHHGRTPPCADALIEAGVARVVVACLDPNPVARGGLECLREAGIEVLAGVLEEQAAAVNERFLTAHRLGRPFVVGKAAVTLDGKIAWPDGQSKWVTGPVARREGHRMRAELGAVLVGRGTVQADDPALTARLRGVHRQPLRVVLDPRGALTGSEQVFQGDGWLWFVERPSREGQVAWRGHRALLDELWRRGVTGLLVEGGGVTLRGFLEQDLLDGLALFVAGATFGQGRPWLPSGDVLRTEWALRRCRRLGDDVLLEWRRAQKSGRQRERPRAEG